MTKISSRNGTFASFRRNIRGNAAAGNTGEEDTVQHGGNAYDGIGDFFRGVKKP
jgi:hypothetical protein